MLNEANISNVHLQYLWHVLEPKAADYFLIGKGQALSVQVHDFNILRRIKFIFESGFNQFLLCSIRIEKSSGDLNIRSGGMTKSTY